MIRRFRLCNSKFFTKCRRTGFLQSDGYSGYEKAAQSENIIQVGCWAHARRKFFDAEKASDPEARPFVLLINLLYRIEHRIRDCLNTGKRSIDELSEIRARRAIRVMNRFFKKAKSVLVLPKSLLGKAIKYALNHEQELRNYILDIRITPDNNFAENQLRPAVLGRKNFLFFGSENGGRNAALLMSLAASCRNLGINFFRYLQEILPQLATSKSTGQLKLLLPHNYQSFGASDKLPLSI